MTLLQNAMKEDELIHFLFPQVIHPLKRFDISPAGGYRSLRSKQYPPVPSTRVCRISIIRYTLFQKQQQNKELNKKSTEPPGLKC